MRELILVAIAGLATAHAASPQQVLEIDTAVGRVIIDDEWRAIRTIGDMPLDRARAILYARDDEEPEAVMAFSLETGEWIRTIPTPEGDGPQELKRGMSGMTLGRDGRLYVAGYVRVLEFDPLGQYVSNWRPQAEVVSDVCELDGQPAIVASSGVIRRVTEGEDEGFGPGIVDRRATTTQEIPGGMRRVISGARPRIACTDDAAYVVTTNAEGSDSVFVYRRNGERAPLALPTEFTDPGSDCKVERSFGTAVVEFSCTNWAEELRPTLDGQGNLVLLGRHYEVPGTIIDLETGCHAVVRKPETSWDYDALNIHQDSALVFHYASWENDQGGFSMSSAADRVSLHPLRRISGEPCPGMLESVG